MANMSHVSPEGRGALTVAAATGLVVPAAGISDPVVSPNADHQPWRLPWTTFWLKPSSKSAMTSPLAGAPQARLPLPPLPVPEPPVPVVPPVPLPDPPVPVVMIVVQVPLVQVWPEVQAWPQLPQLALFEVVSMQLPLQSCWPLTVQVQVPPLQDEPLPQAVQLVPQWAASVFELQAPSEHIMLPAPHPVDEHWPLLQTCPLLHLLLQLPQLSVLEATHEPLQESSPPEQAQAPFWQVLPLPHAFPQAPQFWLSFCVFTHDP